MYEIAAFVNRSRAPLPLCIIQYPTGRFGFVGSVPVELLYSGPADSIADGIKYGIGLVRHRGVKSLSWSTREEAAAAAAAIGATVAD